MKRLKSILGVTVLFIAGAAIVLVLATQSQVQAHPEQKATPATETQAHPPAGAAIGTVVVRGSLHGDLQPPEEPWRNWLR